MTYIVLRCLAILTCFCAVISLLLEAGADAKARALTGATPVSEALTQRDDVLVKYVVERGGVMPEGAKSQVRVHNFSCARPCQTQNKPTGLNIAKL
jgi:hypothetical protein